MILLYTHDTRSFVIDDDVWSIVTRRDSNINNNIMSSQQAVGRNLKQVRQCRVVEIYYVKQ